MERKKTILAFSIPEQLPWRKQTDLVTSKRIEEIVKHRQRELLENEEQFLTDFKKEMKIEYVYESNVASSVGTQNIEEIAKILVHRILEPTYEDSNEGTVTLNMEKAMSEMEKYPDYKLNLEMIKKLHKTLMEGISTIDGKLRSELEYENEVLVKRPDGSIHNYPSHTLVEPMLNGIIKQHNIHMDNIPEAMEDKVPFIIKSAAWLLARFVTIHPFTDGNGRMCRLLANHILSQVIPFPVHAYKTGEVDRSHYLEAIIECQDDNGHPKQLAGLLVDSIYSGLKKMDEKQGKWSETKNYVVIPVKSNDKSIVWEKLKEAFPNATSEDEKKIEELCKAEIITRGDQYHEVILEDSIGKVHYIVRIFKPE